MIGLAGSDRLKRGKHDNACFDARRGRIYCHEFAGPGGSYGEHSTRGLRGTSQLLDLLLGLFIVAVIHEQALTALFQWRVFRRYFDGKALKFPVMLWSRSKW